MTIHRSLAAPSRAKRHRNVLTRRERLAKLEEEGRWSPGKSVFGLPKVRNIKPAAGKKAAKKKEAAAAAAATAAAQPAAAAPAAAKPATPAAAKPAAPAAKPAAPAAKGKK